MGHAKTGVHGLIEKIATTAKDHADRDLARGHTVKKRNRHIRNPEAYARAVEERQQQGVAVNEYLNKKYPGREARKTFKELNKRSGKPKKVSLASVELPEIKEG